MKDAETLSIGMLPRVMVNGKLFSFPRRATATTTSEPPLPFNNFCALSLSNSFPEMALPSTSTILSPAFKPAFSEGPPGTVFTTTRESL